VRLLYQEVQRWLTDGAHPESAPMADPIKHAWPTTLPEQIRLVRGLLGAVSRPVKPAEVGRFFHNAKPARLKEILETLVALGHARKTGEGYSGV